MNTRLADFAQRHSQSTDPYVAEAVTAIRTGTVMLRSVSECASTRELAKIYAFRAMRAAERGQQTVAAAMRLISERCGANPQSLCSIWVLEGQNESFALFELVPSQLLAGCLRFDGPFDEEQHAA